VSEATKLKYCLVASDAGTWGSDPDDTGTVIPVLRSTEIGLDGSVDTQAPALRSLASAERTRTLLHEGDVLVVRSSGSDLHLGKAGYVNASAAGLSFSNFLQRLRFAPEHSPRFGWYFLNSVHAKQQIRKLSSTTTGLQNLSASLIAELEMPTPPLDTQRRISDFLDAETARIDRIHELRTRQQTLLEEAAIRRVYDAVRGTHLKGDRKESGLDWLGTVPANWRVGAVSHYFEVELGKMLNQERAQGDHLRPYLRVANVQWDRIDVTDLAMMDFPPAEQARYRLRPGDLLVNEGGSWPGRAAVWNGEISEIYYQKALHRIRARGKELTRWLYYCLVAAERLRVFQVQGNTSTMTHLTREQLRPQRFPFPEVPTQARLVAELDRAASRDAEVKLLLSRQLTLLTERRQALITAAVTGQFDVTTASGRNVTEGVSA
jgi:type I restriction enzyme S subunit